VAKTKSDKSTKASAAAETFTLADGSTVPLADVAHIAPYLRPFAVRADSLTRDPRNTNLHGDKDLPTTASLLKRFGQRDLLKFDAQRVVKIGNGRHECATDPRHGLNWRYVAAVPEDLSAAELKAFAIGHNRSGRRSDTNVEELERQLEELESELPDFEDLDIGWSEDELEALADGNFEAAHDFAPKPPPKDPPAGEQQYPSVFKIILTCRDEAHQAELIREFERKGYEFTAPNVT
jgi:hypothetical protein